MALRDAASQQQWTEDSSLLDPSAQDPNSTQDVATSATSSAKDKLTKSSSTSDCSLQTIPSKTNWSSPLWYFQFNRKDPEDGKMKPGANSKGCSTFQNGRPKAHPVVHAMNWERLLNPFVCCFLSL
jgi:hypothetical protein